MVQRQARLMTVTAYWSSIEHKNFPTGGPQAAQVGEKKNLIVGT